MLVGFSIALPQALEGLLLIAILAALLSHIGQKKIIVRLLAVSGAAAAAGAGTAYLSLLGRGRAESGPLEAAQMTGAIIGFVLLTGLVLWMQKQTPRRDVELDALEPVPLSGRDLTIGMLLAFVIVFRQVLEAVWYAVDVIVDTPPALLAVGAAIGLVAAVVVAYLAYQVLNKLSYPTYFLISGILFAFAAAGLGGHAVASLEMFALLPPPLSNIAWDTNMFVSHNSVLGRWLHAFTGYDADPNFLSVIFYLGYLVIAGSRLYVALNRMLERFAEEFEDLQDLPAEAN